MAGFATRADLVGEIVNGKIDYFEFTKAGSIPKAIGTWEDYWAATGLPGAGGSGSGAPGNTVSSNQTTQVAGSLWFPDRSTDQKYITRLRVVCPEMAGTVMVYDKLLQVSGVSVAGAGVRTLNTVALGRYTGTEAILNEVWLRTTTSITTTAPAVTLTSYTSADGTTGVAGGQVTFPAVTVSIQTFTQVPLNASKPGVRSVETLTVDVGAAGGAVELVILRPLVRVGVSLGERVITSFLDDIMGLPRVFDGASLGFAFCPTSTSTSPTLRGFLEVAYG